MLASSPTYFVILSKAHLVRECGCPGDTFDEVKSTDRADRNL